MPIQQLKIGRAFEERTVGRFSQLHLLRMPGADSRRSGWRYLSYVEKHWHSDPYFDKM